MPFSAPKRPLHGPCNCNFQIDLRHMSDWEDYVLAVPHGERCKIRQRIKVGFVSESRQCQRHRCAHMLFLLFNRLASRFGSHHHCCPVSHA